MVFSSLLFLFRFLPAILIVYYIVPRPCRNLVLLLFSLAFYAWGEPVYIVLMLASILVSYTGGILIDRFKQAEKKKAAKAALIVSSVLSLSLLAFFKYANFAIGTVSSLSGVGIAVLNIALPIGISFYTFQTISYTIDVYRGEAAVQKNLISFGTYVAMFPQLIAGPIVQYKTIDAQLRSRRETSEQFAEGIHRFMIGLGKKVLLANNAGALWNTIQSMTFAELPVTTAWIGLAAYTFQIYFDFSAYSDMAIGLGHMFGFRFLENFNYPYISKSITEFWRRWHISLSTWFREYVYIPLGGNRRGRVKQLRNITIVWILTGIWHGASFHFLVWGVYYGMLLIIEKLFLLDKLKKWPGWTSRFYTMFFVIIGWVIFAFDSLSQGIGYLCLLFGAGEIPFVNRQFIYSFYNYIILFLFLIAGCTSYPRIWIQDCFQKMKNRPFWIVLENCFYIIIFLLSIAYLVDATYNPFLYFRF